MEQCSQIYVTTFFWWLSLFERPASIEGIEGEDRKEQTNFKCKFKNKLPFKIPLDSSDVNLQGSLDAQELFHAGVYVLCGDERDMCVVGRILELCNEARNNDTCART